MKLLKTINKNKMISLYFEVDKKIDKFNNLEICFFYDLGGYSYYSGRENKRGYYVGLVPCNIKERNGYMTVETTMYRGAKINLKETSRFSKKQFIGAAMSLNMDTLIRLCYEIGLYLDTTVIYEMYKIVKKEIENLL